MSGTNSVPGDGQWVTMEQKQCPVCGKVHDTGNLLLDKFMRGIFPGQYTCTGLEFCPECQKYIDDGYVILIEVKNKPSAEKKNMEVDEADRTGRVCYLKAAVAKDMFGMETAMAFIDQEVFAHLEKLSSQVAAEKETE